MTRPLTLAELMADPGELDVSCLDCHHNKTMPVADLLSCYAAETPFPEVRGGIRCSACGSRRIDVRPYWAARQVPGQITPRSPGDRLTTGLDWAESPVGRLLRKVIGHSAAAASTSEHRLGVATGLIR